MRQQYFLDQFFVYFCLIDFLENLGNPLSLSYGDQSFVRTLLYAAATLKFENTHVVVNTWNSERIVNNLLSEFNTESGPYRIVDEVRAIINLARKSFPMWCLAGSFAWCAGAH